jgi:hypothetical protein
MAPKFQRETHLDKLPRFGNWFDLVLDGFDPVKFQLEE